MCEELVNEQMTAVKRHLQSDKHVAAVERDARRSEARKASQLALELHYNNTNAKGKSLPDAHQVFRLETLRALLISGIALNKLNRGPLRQRLERNNFSLTNGSHLAELMPVVINDEMATLQQEIKGKLMTVIFDGTTHGGAEVLAVVLR
jgi:hypothetical protein